MKASVQASSMWPAKLIEVLLVTAFVVMAFGLAAALLIDPRNPAGDIRNSRRSVDVHTVLNGVYQYAVENNALPADIGPLPTEICASDVPRCGELADLSNVTKAGKYLMSTPHDPQCKTTCSRYGTGYTIKKDARDHLTVSAPAAENGSIISMTR